MEREDEEDPCEAISFGDFQTYFRNKKRKLQLQQEEMYECRQSKVSVCLRTFLVTCASLNRAARAAPDTPQIFEGVIAYVNGYTDPPIHGNCYFTVFLALTIHK